MERLFSAAAPAAAPPAPAVPPGLDDLVALGFDRGSAEAALAAAGSVDIAAEMLCVGLGLQIPGKPPRLPGNSGKPALRYAECWVYRHVPVNCIDGR